MNASRSSAQNESNASENVVDMSEMPLSFDESVLQLLDEPFDTKTNAANLRTDFKYKGFDSTMGKTWIYPTNYPTRQYQLNISRVSLFKNTLVVLPTGLGKTFIASVVMYNIFRWYPKGKIIFMAPTRPLVAQQIDACYQIMGFPKDETVELTGRQAKKIRRVAWHSKRVFYCTPQVVWSDMNDNDINFPINDIKLIVVDEAHKAKGRYAYTEVVQSIWARNKFFRVLALSATPGRNMSDVSEVVQNLLITNIEVRRENSIDVQPYVFKKNIKTVVVPLGERLTEIRQSLHNLVEPYVKNLENHQVIGGNASNLTKAWLLFDRNKFRESTISNRHPDQSSINGDFSVCISMYHAIELLERHGLRVFLSYFNDSDDADEKFFVLKDPKIKHFINEVRTKSNITPINDADMSFYGNLSDVDLEPIDYGHPKFDILQECLVKHFEENEETKAIVFCEYRESVFLINRMLLTKRPLIKPKVFVGQGSQHNRTITQKEQIAIMNDFRSGKCNALIATCVAEEGIDVGEVDFIVCFDVNNKNPIRFVQRIGRTGRKRQGKVTMLVSEGKEQQILREVLATKDGINQKIAKSNEIKSVLYKDNARLVPPEFNPQCIETYIDVKNTQEPSTSKKGKNVKTKKTKEKAPKPPKKATARKGDMRQFFKPVEVDEELEADFDLSTLHGNTSAGNNNNTATSFNSMTEVEIEMNQNEIIRHIAEINPENDHLREKIVKTHSTKPVIVVPDFNTLKEKFEQDYDRFCIENDAKRKWNEFDIRLSKSAVCDKNTPSIIKEFLIKIREECNQCRVFRTKTGEWADRLFDEEMVVACLKSLLEGPPKSATPPEQKDRASEMSMPQNMFDDSQLSFVVQMDCESKYASQLKSQYEHKPPPDEYKPPPDLFMSSTPHKMSKVMQNTTVPNHSPIVSAQRTVIAHEPIKLPKSSDLRINKDDPDWYLKYLRLDSIADLFSDAEIEEEESTKPAKQINKSEEEAKLCDNLNASICGNNTLIEDEGEESQYTVSRILKICEEAERKAIDGFSGNGEVVQTRRKRLYVGSIEDLFCDDDDDEELNLIESQLLNMSSSDDAVNYDVDDAIAPHENLNENIKQIIDQNHSTNLFKDTIDGETSVKTDNVAAKSVTCTKSDDLFSTYNESVANTSKANASNVKDTTNNNQSPNRAENPREQSIHSTPKRSNSSDIFAYYSRSPSVLIKTTSVLSAKFDNNHDKSVCNTSKTSSDKSPTLLSSKLSVLNSQLSLSRHFDDDFDEIKENFETIQQSSPFATCRSSTVATRNQQQQPSNIANNFDCETDMSADDDDIFATCKPVVPSKKKPNGKVKRKTRKPRGKFNFIDDEAGVSGGEYSSDEDFIATQSAMMNITEHADEDDPSVDMQAKYLQSIRSPVGRRHFRIPDIGYRNPVATQNIFSQFVAPDESKYEEDSFVVGSDEEIDSDCTQLSGDESTDCDEITITEIRPNKRKSDEAKASKCKKRRRILEMSSDSD